jgi:hypothetical protein
MKRIFTLGIILCTALSGFAQADTTGRQGESDTIKVGGMIIIRKPGGGREIVRTRRDKDSIIHRRNYAKPANVSTNWWILDLGFSNYNDNTNYANALASGFIGTGVNDETLNLRTFKSRNVNIWFFMQKLNVIKHVVNLKYGLGLELNNYFFDEKKIHLIKNANPVIILDPDYASVDKNKLAADYLTAPVMININFTPKRGRGFGISGGVSAGYLYSSRQKIKDGGHKDKTHDDFDLEKWKISYVGELILGPVKLYGSYATKSMWEKGLDQTPYTVGVRFANW